MKPKPRRCPECGRPIGNLDACPYCQTPARGKKPRATFDPMDHANEARSLGPFAFGNERDR